MEGKIKTTPGWVALEVLSWGTVSIFDMVYN
jgi:hypothetical protein